jgi:hypothetical protein
MYATNLPISLAFAELLLSDLQELVRLDNELQDLKRGIDTPSSFHGAHSQGAMSDAADGKEVRPPGSDSGSDLPISSSLKSPNGFLTLATPLKTPVTTSSESRHGHSQVSQCNSLPCRPGSLEGSQDIDIIKSPVTGSDLSDSHSSVVSRRSFSNARRKSKYDNSQGSARQMLPRSVVEWK